jgi:hypothetical protein
MANFRNHLLQGKEPLKNGWKLGLKNGCLNFKNTQQMHPPDALKGAGNTYRPARRNITAAIAVFRMAPAGS